MMGFHKEVSAVHVKGMHLVPDPHPDGRRAQVFPLTAVGTMAYTEQEITLTGSCWSSFHQAQYPFL